MNWIDIDDIVSALEECYSDDVDTIEDVEEIKISYLKEIILALNDFEEHDVSVDNSLLIDIKEAWCDFKRNS